MNVLDIIFNSLSNEENNYLDSLMRYVDTDTLVGWFVDEGCVDYLDDDNERDTIMDWYEKHCK